MNKFIKNFKSILLCLFELIAGLLVVINSKGFHTIVIIAAGFGLILTGLVQVIKYYRAEPKAGAQKNFLMKGLLLLSTGCFCAFRSNWFMAVLPSFSFALGVGIFMIGLTKIQKAMDMVRMDQKQWYYAFIGAAVSLACAATILNGPVATKKILWSFTGIILVFVAIADTAMLVTRIFPKKPKAVEAAQEEVPQEETPAAF